MKKIKGDLVGEIASKCGKKIKVKEIIDLYEYTFKNIESETEIVKGIKEKIGNEAFEEFYNHLLVMFALTLLARTNDPKDFENIMSKCQVEVDC